MTNLTTMTNLTPMTSLTKTLIATGAALMITSGAALAQGGGYYSFGPGASDYSNVVLVPENQAVAGVHPNAITSAPTYEWVDQYAETQGPVFGGHAGQAYIAQTGGAAVTKTSEVAEAR